MNKKAKKPPQMAMKFSVCGGKYYGSFGEVKFDEKKKMTKKPRVLRSEKLKRLCRKPCISRQELAWQLAWYF